MDLLVANPPYSVRGFLETLSAVDRERYRLTTAIEPKSRDTNNKIEAFFVERAIQLLKPGGVAAIVLPSSILSNNDGPTRAARELVLGYFDIIAIVELGSGAFGSTGTNAVTLFLRRKLVTPDTEVHVASRVKEWFSGNFPGDVNKQQRYADEGLVRSYAHHLGIDDREYTSLLKGSPSEALLASTLFKEYREAFEASQAAKRLRNSSAFGHLTRAEQERGQARVRRILQGHRKEQTSYLLHDANSDRARDRGS